MPTRDRRTDITMDPELEATLRQVRESHGLESDEAAMEFLLSRSIRVNGNRMTGRGRALYEVKRGPSD
ncbi:hypothetical protein [Vreelandella neptunia]|uniref:Uncharacterized protein n=1 Tax=Vreelandella neptunia TaxID=115551 RepID=A0ABZ0YIA9_9GAMM|nr:hypothetical protein [Halomonas neptunia]MDN3562133.1 hypothetical protein [Halomonas neptunia]WQH11835.1 hypothetical protein SR894_16985 [Halomonas neptunia]